MRSTLALLLLFGAGIGVITATHTCTKGNLPTEQEESCELTIDFLASDDKQAFERCLQDWSTSFVKHVKGQVASATTILCTVYAKPQCELYTLPSGKTPQGMSCEITIDYRARDANQALATCLEYFPTTFVKGERTTTGMTKCIVTAAYQCVEWDTFLMFDKCYRFPKKTWTGEYVKGTIADYLDENKKADFCDGGKLSVFYSYTHAKFVGMKAHRENIDKLWIGINSEGKSIEDNTMMHSKIWKLVEGDYWDGDKPKKIPMKEDGSGNLILDENKKPIPDLTNSPYYFMRTRTDNVYNRMQGHFERASANVEATFACEFDSKFTENQAWYCSKLPMLGIDAVWQDDHQDYYQVSQPQRCLYVTLGSYAFNGKPDQMKSIKGCQETPSEIHSAGIDDGTGEHSAYKLFKTKGKLRIAGHIVERVKQDNSFGKVIIQEKCTKTPFTSADSNTLESLRMKWKHVNHHGVVKHRYATNLQWTDNPYYPMNECSDFPGTSSSLGILNGRMVDMPPEVRAPAVCSIMFFQECENKKPCEANPKLYCRNLRYYLAHYEYKGFFACGCPPSFVYDEKLVAYKTFIENGEKKCKWTGGDDKCALLRFYGGRSVYQDKNTDRDLDEPSRREIENNKLEMVIVCDGCTLTAKSWSRNNGESDVLVNVGYGEHHVPNAYDGSLGNDVIETGASSTQCTCP